MSWDFEEQAENLYNQEARIRMVEEGVIEAWEALFLDGVEDALWEE